MTADATLARKTRGGRPKSDPTTIRTATIGVRVSASEYTRLREKACQLGITPAQWLREAALSRRLPPPPVPAVNREHYAELARLSANLNQLAKAANESRPVIVSTTLLNKLTTEVKRLRFALIGVEADP